MLRQSLLYADVLRWRRVILEVTQATQADGAYIVKDQISYTSSRMQTITKKLCKE